MALAAGAALATAYAVRQGAGILVILAVLALALLAVAASALYVTWLTDPTRLLIAGVLLSPLAGFWPEVGVPASVSPHRLLLLAAVAAIVLRAPAVRDRPAIPPLGVHWAMAAAGVYVIGSAAVAGTLLDRPALFALLEAYGIALFAVFFVAPVAFDRADRRDLLLPAFVALGAYLGLTAFLETLDLTNVVFPRYIGEPYVGIHFGRARGPFVEAVTNGTAMFACALVAAIAFVRWRGRLARTVSLGTIALCGAGIVMTQQRSVWLATIVATLVVGLAVGGLRRRLVPILVAGLALTAIAFAVVPSGQLSERAGQRDTVYDRYNMNRAALNMIEDRPLFGFGWARFSEASVSGDFFRIAPEYPLTAVGVNVHNELLSHAAELGLVGAAIWFTALLLAVAAGLTAPVTSPDLALWKAALLAYATFYLVVSNFVPPQLFPNLLLWLFAGIACAGRVVQVQRAVP